MSLISKQVEDLRRYAESRKGVMSATLTMDAADIIETLSEKFGEKNLYGTDWVAVTRCKDCKHWKHYMEYGEYEIWCSVMARAMPPHNFDKGEFFCAAGEPREEA